MLSHAVFGVITIYTASVLGHKSLFDAKPLNNYLPPTCKTTEEQNK